MHRIDLEVAPIERPIRIVVVDLARASWILGALDREGQAACRTKLVARVLLVGRQAMAELVGLSLRRVVARTLGGNYQRPLKVDPHGRLKTERVPVPEDEKSEGGDHCHEEHEAAECTGSPRFGPTGPTLPGAS